MKLNATQISVLCGARIDRAERHTVSLNSAMERYAIDTTAQRQAMFLANIGHESGGLKFCVELWGPDQVPAQRTYERDFCSPWPADAQEAKLPEFSRNRKAFRLGNVNKGDGRRYCGRAWMQNTGRGNYIRARDRLRAKFPELQVPDFEAEPEKLADPVWAALVSADYVDMVGLNRVADEGRFDNYCDLINLGKETEDEGDTNGWEHRLALYTRGLPVLEQLHDRILTTERYAP